jgi:hypothetical protein
MFGFGNAKGEYFVAVAKTLKHMRVVVNVDVSAETAHKIAKKYRRLKCSPPEAALFIGRIAAGLRLKEGDLDGAEEVVKFIKAECDSLKTPMTNAAREQTEQIRTELYGRERSGPTGHTRRREYHSSCRQRGAHRED